jgi:hypothetical protein
MSTRRQLLTACGVALAIALPSQLAAQDFWSSLGFNEDAVKEKLIHVLIEGSVFPPSVPSLRAMPSAARNSLISTGVSYAKRWTKTPDFSQRYDEYRNGKKPELPEELMTTAQRKAQDKAALQKTIVSLDSVIQQAKGMPEVQAGLRSQIQQLRAEIKAIDDPANPMYSKDAQASLAESHAQLRQEYAKALNEWETRYPANATPRIRENLRAYVALAATVDFAAKTQKHPEGGVTFVNPEYEAKSSEWKALFRAGKETTAALQAAAQQWLTELR